MIKSYNMIRVIKRLSVNLYRNVLLRTCELFIRPHLDCGNIYDKPNNETFKNKIEMLNTKLALQKNNNSF